MSDEKSVIDIDKTLALYGYIAVKKSDHAALTARAEAAEAEAKRLKDALTKIAEDPIIGMYQMREIAKKSLKGGE